MRLNRLDLIRYGRFKDAEIAFPKPAEGAPDVTVIFGRNEAGKSTAFNGFLELLFGFKGGAHPYAFRFDRSDLLVGAELNLPERGTMVLRRNSKRTQSLLDANDRPINEAILSGALHGLTRDAYEERFSLNEKGLREGGERIAGAQGDLGQLLHAGLSGLTGMAQTLDSLAERADKFHKKRGRATVLKTGSDRLKEIGRELRADRLTTERELKLRHDRNQTQAEFEAADAELRQTYQRQAASRAAEVWYDRTEEIGQLTEVLVDFPDGPDLPPGASERVAGLVEKIAAQTIRIREAEEEIAKQDQIIADHPADKLAQRLTAELERLDQLTVDGAPLMGRASTARADLDRRREDLDKLKRQTKEVLGLLEVPDAPVSTIVLEASVLEEIATAVQECLTTSLSSEAALNALEAARAQQGEAPAEPQDLNALRDAFEDWKAVADISTFEASRDQGFARLNKVTAGLPKSWKDRVAAGLPAPETLEEVGREWATLTASLASARSDLKARAAELAEARADLSTQKEAPDAVDIIRTEETRRQRDILWQQHRGDLTNETADQFEVAMFADDGARAHYLTGAEARQRLVAAQGQVRSAEARHETAKSRHDGLVAQRDRISEHCSRLALALGLEADATASAFSPRQQALTTAADAAADLANAENALKDRLAHQKAARDALTDAALPLGLAPAQYDVVCFDEVSGISFDQKDGVNIMKGYMESGEFSRGRESIRAEGSIVMVGNFDVDVQHQQRVGHLFGPMPPEMRNDTAFMDRIHSYLPGWDVPKVSKELFTDHFGLVSDVLAECFSRLRAQSRVDRLSGRVHFGGALSGRDQNAVNKTTSGLLKLLYPDPASPVSDDDLEWAVRLGLEVRRRVKEQQKRIGSAEFRNTQFSYVMGLDGVEKFVSTPELQSENSIGADPLPAGQVWTISPGGQDEGTGLFRIEVNETSGGGVKILNQSPPGPFKESVRIAEQNLYAHARELVGERNPREHEFSIQLRAFDAARNGSDVGIPVLMGLCSALLRKPIKGGLIISGGITLGGSLEPIHNPIDLVELAMEKGAEAVLLPVSSRRALIDLSDDVATKVQVLFYADAADALRKCVHD